MSSNTNILPENTSLCVSVGHFYSTCCHLHHSTVLLVPLAPGHRLKLFECRIRCDTPKASHRGGGEVVNFDLRHWPKTLSAFRLKKVITARIFGQTRRRPPTGTTSSSAPSLNIITHIKSKHGRSGQLLPAPAVFTRGKILLASQTCSSPLVCYLNVCVELGATTSAPIMPCTANLCIDLFLSISNTLNIAQQSRRPLAAQHRRSHTELPLAVIHGLFLGPLCFLYELMDFPCISNQTDHILMNFVIQ